MVSSSSMKRGVSGLGVMGGVGGGDGDKEGVADDEKDVSLFVSD